MITSDKLGKRPITLHGIDMITGEHRTEEIWLSGDKEAVSEFSYKDFT